MTSASAHAWLQRAERDLAIAHRGEFPDDACYHCQQAVEKALKALLVAYSRDVPRHHRLTNILNELPKETKVPLSFREHCLILEQYYLATRYPDIPEEPQRLFTPSDAGDALRRAEEIVTFAHRALAERLRP